MKLYIEMEKTHWFVENNWKCIKKIERNVENNWN